MRQLAKEVLSFINSLIHSFIDSLIVIRLPLCDRGF